MGVTAKQLHHELGLERDDVKNLKIVVEYNDNEYLEVSGFHCDGERFVLEVDSPTRLTGPAGEDV